MSSTWVCDSRQNDRQTKERWQRERIISKAWYILFQETFFFSNPTRPATETNNLVLQNYSPSPPAACRHQSLHAGRGLARLSSPKTGNDVWLKPQPGTAESDCTCALMCLSQHRNSPWKEKRREKAWLPARLSQERTGHLIKRNTRYRQVQKMPSFLYFWLRAKRQNYFLGEDFAHKKRLDCRHKSSHFPTI